MTRALHATVPFEFDVPLLIYPAAGDAPRPVVVVLHGQGMRPESFARRWRALGELDAHIAFPRGIYPLEVGGTSGPAPRRIGYGWYTYDGDALRFMNELARGTEHLARVIDVIERHVPVTPRGVALVGFSQGGYLAYIAALRLRERIAALVGAACRLKAEAALDEIRQDRARFPILHVHGQRDESVAFTAATAALAPLREHGWEVSEHAYAGGHLLGAPEIAAIRHWLARTLDVASSVPSRIEEEQPSS